MPTGNYKLTAVVDLSPLFGVQSIRKSIHVEQAPADQLERRIAEISSKDPMVRQQAIYDLMWFEDSGERIAPIIGKLLDSEDAMTRSAALSVLRQFGPHALPFVPKVIALLKAGPEDPGMVMNAAWFLAIQAPVSEEVGEALKTALTNAKEEWVKQSVQYAVAQYERRAAGGDK